MSSLEELCTQHQAQGTLVAELKKAKDAGVKDAVTKLLEIKKAITALQPDHEYALKKKESKKNKVKATNPDGTPVLSKKELRIQAKQLAARKKAEETANKMASATNYGDAPLIQSQEITGRQWTRLENASTSMNGKKSINACTSPHCAPPG